MSAQFSDSFFSISRRYTQNATGDICNVVSCRDVLERYQSGNFQRVPHWIKVKSAQGHHLELELLGRHRSANADSIIVARPRDSKIKIITMSVLQAEFTPVVKTGLFTSTPNDQLGIYDQEQQ